MSRVVPAVAVHALLFGLAGAAQGALEGFERVPAVVSSSIIGLWGAGLGYAAASRESFPAVAWALPLGQGVAAFLLIAALVAGLLCPRLTGANSSDADQLRDLSHFISDASMDGQSQGDSAEMYLSMPVVRNASP